MKLNPLHDRFLQKLGGNLPGWKFVARNRHFRKRVPGKDLLVHVAFIDHPSDFDAVLDVAVEFVSGKERVCIVGASLGNLEGIGQVRYRVVSEHSADVSAQQAIEQIQRVGVPFFERYGDIGNVIATLRRGGPEAMLISPLLHLHQAQIAALERIGNAG